MLTPSVAAMLFRDVELLTGLHTGAPGFSEQAARSRLDLLGGDADRMESLFQGFPEGVRLGMVIPLLQRCRRSRAVQPAGCCPRYQRA
jgi:hypothetical protein